MGNAGSSQQEYDEGSDEDKEIKIYEEKPHSLEQLRLALETSDTQDERQKVVLVTTGSFCPVHKMHLQVFQAAKEFLTEHPNFNVISGFISPSHDEYVRSKLPESFIPATHRAEMCRRAIDECEEYSWISVDEWECTQQYFKSFYQVVNSLDITFQKEFPEETFRVMYLCGADLILRCNGMSSAGKFSIVAVGRPGYSEPLQKLINCNSKMKELFFVSKDTEDISSTLIRERLAEGKSVDDLTFKSVAEYLKLNGPRKFV